MPQPGRIGVGKRLSDAQTDMVCAPFILKADVQQMSAQCQLGDDPGVVENFAQVCEDSRIEGLEEALRPMVSKPAQAPPFLAAAKQRGFVVVLLVERRQCLAPWRGHKGRRNWRCGQRP